MTDVDSMTRTGASSPPVPCSQRAGGAVSRRPRLAVRRIRGYDFSAYSDRALKSSLHRLKGHSGPDNSLEAFALVNEAISRRLGAWRLFDPGSDKGALRRYDDLAFQIIEASPYRNLIEFYSDPDFLDGHPFLRSIAPMMQRMGLDGDEEAIVKAVVYVAEKSRVSQASDVLLPAQFYRAVAAKDLDGVLSFRASDEQLLVGLLLSERATVEMSAGEGKTIAAAFPAVWHALRGRSVHVITANEYLAARDADWLGPVYESLGLSVGVVLSHMEDQERRLEYRRQIVYGTLREFGFDFMRDNLKLPPDEPVQGRLDVAIVDEADHALIDQARTPLVISGNPAGSRRGFERARRTIEKLVSLQAEAVCRIEAELGRVAHRSDNWKTLLAKLLMASPGSEVLKRQMAQEPRLYTQALAMIDREEDGECGNELTRDLFYVVDSPRQLVTLTERGQRFLEGKLGPLFDTSSLEQRLALVQADSQAPLEQRRRLRDRSQRRLFRQNNRMNQVYQMLRAYVLLKRDVDYVVAEGSVVLIDESTGRTLPDNRYRWGLHAALEAKEDLPVNAERETLAQISVQGFISRYSHVAGMTGTALEARDEFEQKYGLKVVVVAPTRPPIRVDYGARLYLDRRDKLAAIVDEVEACKRVGRPVLVGTLTIEQSEELSRLLYEHGIEHDVLNAVTNSAEAAIIKNAGSFGAVTIATNMAGRGTDIVLEPGADRRIIEEYAKLVLDLLNNHVGQVELGCGTPEEATLLHKALATRHGLTIVRDSAGPGPYGTVLAVSKGPGGPLADRRVRLEFGLGLYVLGTEKNEAARVDRQLKGRSGRQGDFGGSRFILSLEDPFLQFRGDNGSSTSDRPQIDEGGRTFYEGPRLERHLARVQGQSESDEEDSRDLSRQYWRVLEAQATAYYRGRREVVEAVSFHDDCRGFVAGWAERFVARYLPESRLYDYAQQFERMAEELRLDLGLDCDGLYGAGLDTLSVGVGRLVAAGLEDARARVGDIRFTRLEKLLFLHTADEMWRGHLDDLEESVLSVSLGHFSLKAALAEFGHKSFEAYELFRTRAVDAFLPRLLMFQLETVTEDAAEEIILTEDVLSILV